MRLGNAHAKQLIQQRTVSIRHKSRNCQGIDSRLEPDAVNYRPSKSRWRKKPALVSRQQNKGPSHAAGADASNYGPTLVEVDPLASPVRELSEL